MTKIKAIFFDLDGTLLDTAQGLAQALNIVLEKHGKTPLPLHEVEQLTALGSRELLKYGFHIEPGDAAFPSLRAEYLAAYEQTMLYNTRLFPGVSTVLDNLDQRQLVWGIVTNKPQQFTNPLLVALTLDQRAHCIISGDTLAHAKPHPAPLLHACELTHVSPQESVYVGDTWLDCEAALAAGMSFCWALYGYSQLPQHYADDARHHRLKRVEDLLLLLDK